MIKKPFSPITVIFFIIMLSLIACSFIFSSLSAAFNALLVGNFVLFIATYFSFNFYLKAIGNNSTQFFLRMVYSAMISKMVICIAAVLTYAFMIEPVSKAAILIFFGLYFMYTFAEVRIVTRLNKEKKNG